MGKRLFTSLCSVRNDNRILEPFGFAQDKFTIVDCQFPIFDLEVLRLPRRPDESGLLAMTLGGLSGQVGIFALLRRGLSFPLAFLV